MKISFDPAAAEDIIRQIKTIEQMRTVAKGIKLAAFYIRGRIGTYPIQRPSEPNMMLRGTSDKAKRMRAGFFYALSKGEIDVPYIRGKSKSSKKLGQSWTIDTKNSGLTAIIGTSVGYAPLVQDKNKQTQYHQKTGWVTTDDVKEKYNDEVQIFIYKSIMEVINGRK